MYAAQPTLANVDFPEYGTGRGEVTVCEAFDGERKISKAMGQPSVIGVDLEIGNLITGEGNAANAFKRHGEVSRGGAHFELTIADVPDFPLGGIPVHEGHGGFAWIGLGGLGRLEVAFPTGDGQF